MNQLKSCWGQNSSTRKKLKVQHNFISVTWKQIKTETDQKNPGSLLIIWNFMRFLLLSRKSLKTHFMRNFPFYYSVSRIIYSITLFMGYIFLGISPYFDPFLLIFDPFDGFQKKLQILSLLIEFFFYSICFRIFLDRFLF